MIELNFVTLALASFIFAITPGPGIVAVLAVTINRGMTAGTTMSIGMVLGDMIYLLAVMVSIANFANHLGSLLMVIRILGAAYLAWLGYRQYISPPLVVGTSPLSSKNVIVSAATGFMISITNPKVMVFYLSFLPLFIDLNGLDVTTGMQVVMVMFISVLMGPMAVVWLAHHARAWDCDDVTGRWINRLTGLALMAVAFALVVTI
jgi:threonine/homoserine/homoserine lactone efflux protein